MAEEDRDDFRQRIRWNFERQAAMTTIGAELTRVEHGMVEMELPFDLRLTQHHGILHAGIISAALDTACGFAAYSVIDPDASILTIEFKVNLLSPGRATAFPVSRLGDQTRPHHHRRRRPGLCHRRRRGQADRDDDQHDDGRSRPGGDCKG